MHYSFWVNLPKKKQTTDQENEQNTSGRQGEDIANTVRTFPGEIPLIVFECYFQRHLVESKFYSPKNVHDYLNWVQKTTATDQQ